MATEELARRIGAFGVDEKTHFDTIRSNRSFESTNKRSAPDHVHRCLVVK